MTRRMTATSAHPTTMTHVSRYEYWSVTIPKSTARRPLSIDTNRNDQVVSRAHGIISKNGSEKPRMPSEPPVVSDQTVARMMRRTISAAAIVTIAR